MRPATAPVAAGVIAAGQTVLRADSQLEVGILIAEACGCASHVEAADDDRCLIDVRARNVLRRQQDDARVPVRPVDAQVHAPQLQHGIVDDVGCPHVAVDAIVAVGCRPCLSVELQLALLAAHGDGLRHVRHEGFLVGHVAHRRARTVHRAPQRIDSRPVHQVLRAGRGAV